MQLISILFVGPTLFILFCCYFHLKILIMPITGGLGGRFDTDYHGFVSTMCTRLCSVNSLERPYQTNKAAVTKKPEGCLRT